MKKRILTAACAVGLLAGGAALAVKPGETLFVKAKNTKVYDKPTASGKVKATLQPGDEVTWDGADKKDPAFHAVSGKVKGFAHQSSLSPRKPAGEVLTNDGAPVSGQAFASSGAATKALTEAGIKYSDEKGADAKTAAIEVIWTEEHTKRSIENDAVGEHAKKQGLGGGK